MKSLTANFEAMLSLYEMKEGKSLTKQPIFETWPLSIFGKFCNGNFMSR